jgi:hypothetical protein
MADPFLLRLLCCCCRSAPEQLAERHPVVAAILKAKCRKYAGTYKVRGPQQPCPDSPAL